MKILDVISFSPTTFALKVAKPKFVNKKQIISSDNTVPYPKFDNNNSTNFHHDVYVIPYIEKYYHNMMEIWTNILYLHNNSINFKLVVVVNTDWDYDPEEKVPHGWRNTGDPNMYCFRQLLENHKIDYVCYSKDSKEYKEMCPRSAFIFFDKKEYLYTDHLTYSYPKELYFKSYFPHEPCVSQKPEALYDRVELLFKWAPRYKMKDTRIYITRKNYEDRSLKNEDFLIDYLKDRGYEIVYFENHSVMEQIRIVQEASHIVVQSGSSLLNCMFASKEAKIFEIETEFYPVGLYKDVFEKYNMNWTKKRYQVPNGMFVAKRLESDQEFQNAFVAQRTEQDSSKVLVAGSTPAEGAK